MAPNVYLHPFFYLKLFVVPFLSGSMFYEGHTDMVLSKIDFDVVDFYYYFIINFIILKLLL